ncbi:hypothetical protein CROQUDRAFT_137218, partial [Cronartium quercuum f. sp. fusiforme G11]
SSQSVSLVSVSPQSSTRRKTASRNQGEEDVHKVKENSKEGLFRKSQKVKFAIEDGEEGGMIILEDEEWDQLEAFNCGFSIGEQEKLCRSWGRGEVMVFAAKYKPVDKKVQPVNAAMPQQINLPLQHPPLLQDPYKTPLSKVPPDFVKTSQTTLEHLKMVNFGPAGWILDEEMRLMLHVLVVREKAVAYCEEERGLLKEEYGLPYVIPVVDHQPWQQ